MKLNAPGNLNTLNQTQLQQDNLLKKLSTAKRINSAADDAAGLQIANQLSSSINAKAQGERNVYDGVSLGRIYEQGLQGITDNLGELNRLAVAAGNGIYAEQDRAALQAEADGYTANIQQVIDNTEFAGQKLLNQDGALSFATGAGSLSFSTVDVGAGLTGQNVFSLDLSSAQSAQTALGTIQQSLDYISGLQADAGASINSFTAAAGNISGQQIAESAARSRIEDLDLARASSDKVAADIRSNSSVSVALQARVQQQQAFELLS